MSGREPPPPYFGDYPNGAYWSAFPPPGTDLEDDQTLEVVGLIRFRMPEEDVDFPLWDDCGLLPEETEVLEAGLGLSLELIVALKDWGAAWNTHRRRFGGDREGREVHEKRLATAAADLVGRMRGELREGLRVELDLR